MSYLKKKNYHSIPQSLVINLGIISHPTKCDKKLMYMEVTSHS